MSDLTSSSPGATGLFDIPEAAFFFFFFFGINHKGDVRFYQPVSRTLSIYRRFLSPLLLVCNICGNHHTPAMWEKMFRIAVRPGVRVSCLRSRRSPCRSSVRSLPIRSTDHKKMYKKIKDPATPAGAVPRRQCTITIINNVIIIHVTRQYHTHTPQQ